MRPLACCRFALFGSILLLGCSSNVTVEEVPLERVLENKYNKTTLQITVDSIPPGASIYGYEGDALGECLGRTPMTLRYCLYDDAEDVSESGGARTIFHRSGSDWKQAYTLDAGGPLEYAIYHTEGSHGDVVLIGDYLKHTAIYKITGERTFFPKPEASFAFKCYLVLDKYKTKEVNELVEKRQSDPPRLSVFQNGGQKTYTYRLEREN